jgi:multiple sugar transport system ATP-binding protein
MNLLPGELDGTHLHVPMVDLELPAEVTDHLVAGAGGKVIVGIRPENFEGAALVTAPEAAGATFTAKIDVIEWLGSELFAHFEVEGSAAAELADLAADLESVNIGTAAEQAQIVARLDVQSEARERTEQEIWVDARSIHLFDPETGASLVQRPR